MATTADALSRVRALCLAQPEVSERLSHGSPTFFVREKKTFASLVDNHHGDGRLAIWCAAPPGAQEALIASDPQTFFRPAYVGHRGWVGMRLDRKPDWKLVAAVLAEGYAFVAASLPRARA